jgi:hypothetical protein
MWADDVDGVIRTLVEADALRLVYGHSSSSTAFAIAAMIRSRRDQVRGWITTRQSQAMSVTAPELLSLVPGLFTTDAEESERSLNSLLGLFFASEVSPDERKRMLELTCPFLPTYGKLSSHGRSTTTISFRRSGPPLSSRTAPSMRS